MRDLRPLAGTQSSRLSFPGLAWLDRHCPVGQQTRAASEVQNPVFTLQKKKAQVIYMLT